MPKAQPDRPQSLTAAADAADHSGAVPPLSPSIRRHLGRNLRGHYADSLSAPVSERLEALIAQLDKPAD